MTTDTQHRATIQPPTDATLQHAIELLRAGEPIGLPTETVYGLAADATNDEAVARIFELKQRPQFNPLIVHCRDFDAVRALVEMPPLAEKLAETYWPGPLTLVLRRLANCPISLLASAGLDTLAVRVPAHSVAQRLLEDYEHPVAAPSANPSGKLSPTTASAVADSLPLPLIIDGGPCTVGLESTILAVDGNQVTLLRPGGIPVEDLETTLKVQLSVYTQSEKVSAPGQLASHYAPRAALRLNATEQRSTEVLLGFGEPAAGQSPTANLSPSGDLREAAANLFRMLHDLDDMGAACIAVMPIPETGLGRAINDRLRRAAAPRDP